MKRFKKILRLFVLTLMIIIASIIPVPISFNKKDGKFNDDNLIELVEQKENNTETEAKNLGKELNS